VNSKLLNTVLFLPKRGIINPYVTHKWSLISQQTKAVIMLTFRQCRIIEYTWTSPDGKTNYQIDHVLIDRRWQTNILDVRSFRGAECDMDQYLVVAKVRESLAVRKQAAQKFDGERFNLRKLKEQEVKEKYQIEITNRFAAL
jgi:hypothetical protein